MNLLRQIRVKRVALVDKGANFDEVTKDGAHIMLYKSDSMTAVHSDKPVHVPNDPTCKCAECDKRDEYEKGLMSSETRNALPDSAFAAVWTDASGNKQRKLPYKTSSGAIDRNHLNNALSRFSHTSMPESVRAKAKAKLEAAKKSHKEPRVMKILDNLARVLKSVGAKDTIDNGTLETLRKQRDEIAELLKTADDADKVRLQVVHDALAKAVNDADADDEQDDPAPGGKKKVGKEDGGADDDEDGSNMAKRDRVLKAEMAELRKRAEDAEAIAKSERNARLDAEMTTLLKSFKATPFKLEGEDNDVQKFRKMQDTDKSLFDRTIEMFKTQDELLSKSRLFSMTGSARSGSADAASAEAQLMQKAKDLVSKSGDKYTPEQAFEKVCLDPDNKELLKQYRNGQQ